MKLFEDELPEDTGVEDNTNITTLLLYFSEEQSVEFKTLAKRAIKQELGQEYQQKGNLSDLLLTVLRKHPANANITA